MKIARPLSMNILGLLAILIAFSVHVSRANASSVLYRVLIAPGHEPQHGGAIFRNVRERDLASDLSVYMSDRLKSAGIFEVRVTRDRSDWDKTLTQYINREATQIIGLKFCKQLLTELSYLSQNRTRVDDAVPHSYTDYDSSLRLYGTNMWANHNKIDLVVNVHFNNDNRLNTRVRGANRGFSIYIPSKDMSNSINSRKVAQYIYDELKQDFEPDISSTARDHASDAIYEDQSLIALGANDTLVMPSVLIEYAYVYEKMFDTDDSTKSALSIMASDTVRGINKYFNNEKH